MANNYPFLHILQPLTACQTILKNGKLGRKHIFLGKDRTHFFYFTDEGSHKPQTPRLDSDTKTNIRVRTYPVRVGDGPTLADCRYSDPEFEQLRKEAIEYLLTKTDDKREPIWRKVAIALRDSINRGSSRESDFRKLTLQQAQNSPATEEVREPRAFLLIWNPRIFPKENFLPGALKQIARDGKKTMKWSCGNTKAILPGDRVFLMRVGVEPKGIIGAGKVASHPEPVSHPDENSFKSLYIDVDFEELLDADEGAILSRQVLETGKLKAQNWMPQSNGIAIRAELVEELEARWFNLLASLKNYITPSNEDIAEALFEGTALQVVQTRFERNPYARKLCIEHHGVSCSVCRFDFGKSYGEVGAGFIHVHHQIELSTRRKRHRVDPIEDLCPVCPNCHAMLHKRNPCYTIEELRAMLKR